MWYYFYNQQSFGPVSLEEIIRLIQMGVLTNTTLVWQPQQARRQAGQVPELAQYFQQSSRARPQPVSQGVAMSPPPISGQGYASGTQQTSMGGYNPTGSTGGRKGSLFQDICVVAVIVCSLISAFGTLHYWARYEKKISTLSRYGVYAIDDDATRSCLSSASSVSIAFCLFAFLFCVPVTIIGIIREKYLKVIVCVIVSLAACGYYIYIEISEECKEDEVKQQRWAIPYYDKLELHARLNPHHIKSIAEHWDYDPDPEEVEWCTQLVVDEFKELDEFNARTLEMLISGANPNEFRNRYEFANQNYLQINRQLDSVYKS